jgi:hypothetical protein
MKILHLGRNAGRNGLESQMLTLPICASLGALFLGLYSSKCRIHNPMCPTSVPTCRPASHLRRCGEESGCVLGPESFETSGHATVEQIRVSGIHNNVGYLKTMYNYNNNNYYYYYHCDRRLSFNLI